jgi:GNAT superfamily N-acetyltransferase
VQPTRLTSDHVDAFLAFVDRLDDADVAFISERPHDADTVRAWASGRHAGRHWVVLDDQGAVGAYVAVVPLTGWASHVGELRLVVRPDLRGQGLGTSLARHALLEAAGMDLHKLQVNLVAEQEPLVSMFNLLGFQPEALLADHFRTRDGEYLDLMILTHSARDEWAALATIGVDQALADQDS